MEIEHKLAVALFEAVFRQVELLEPAQEFGREDLPRAIKAVTRQPDHLLSWRTAAIGVIEMRPQLIDVDFSARRTECLRLISEKVALTRG